MGKERLDRWGVLWRSKNHLDGTTEHLMWEGGLLLMFRSRRDARGFVQAKYGYIKHSPDLLGEPHGWRLPRPVRLTEITYDES